MRVLVFGSRALGVRCLSTMQNFLLASVLYRFDDSMGPIPLEWINQDLAHRIPDDARFVQGPHVLIHGDGPPGKVPGAIGADKLAEVAAALVWPETRRVKRFPPDVPALHTHDEWARAAARRNVAMVEHMRPTPDGRGSAFRVLCFHTDLDSSRGSIITANALRERGLPFTYVRVKLDGSLVSVEER